MILYRTIPEYLPASACVPTEGSADHLPPLDSPFPGLFSVRRAWQIFRAKEEREYRARQGVAVTIKGSRN